MEIFYTPEDVEKEYGIQTKTLANWRANLIGPDCIKWKNKILYHTAEIEEWFETQNLDLDNTDPEPKENSKPESESMPKPESNIKPQPKKKPQPEKKIYENPSPSFLVIKKTGYILCSFRWFLGMAPYPKRLFFSSSSLRMEINCF